MTVTSYPRQTQHGALDLGHKTHGPREQNAKWEDVKQSKFYVGGNLSRSIAEGPLVKEAREFLLSEGYEVSSGKWSDADHSALTQYQRKNGLVPDGLLGPLTGQTMGLFKNTNGRRLSQEDFNLSLGFPKESTCVSLSGRGIFPERPGIFNVSHSEMKAIVLKACAEYGVSKSLVLAVISTESAGNGSAVSPKGARGLMQLMPGTARAFGVTNVYDPHQNIFAGTKFLSNLLKQFNGDESLALAGYNAGPGAVAKYNGIPPYPETEDYVRKVLARKAAPDT